MINAISDGFARRLPFSSAQFPPAVAPSQAQIVAGWRDLFRRDGESVAIVDGAIVLSHGLDCQTVLGHVAPHRYVI